MWFTISEDRNLPAEWPHSDSSFTPDWVKTPLPISGAVTNAAPQGPRMHGITAAQNTRRGVVLGESLTEPAIADISRVLTCIQHLLQAGGKEDSAVRPGYPNI